METRNHYQVNVCGGDFQNVRVSFLLWKNETLVYRRAQRMFEGRDDVRMLSNGRFADSERARVALEDACKPHNSYALAAEVDDGERHIWIVMAAYRE